MSPLKKLGMLNRQGMQSLNSGNCDDALFQLVQAERLARSMQSPLHEAKVRNNIGLVHQQSGNSMAAMVSFQVAWEQAVKGAGPDTRLHQVIKRNMSRLQDALKAEAV